MRTRRFRSSVMGALLLPALAIHAQDTRQTRPQYSAEELDNLVAPVALYADPLLAQVLVAATFTDQLALAYQYVRTRGAKNIENQEWDPSVKAVAHYPPVLNMLAKQEDWAIALGQAYAAQPGDVLDAVQRLRLMAREQGNLESTPEQNVTQQRDYIVIEPANPEVIYVPTYEPYYVYAEPLYPYSYHYGFGIGFPYGPWLSYGCDWFAGRVYWHGGGCVGCGYVSPYINGFGTLNPRRYVPTNPGVYGRTANYANLDRDYRSVRSDVNFARHSKPGSGTVAGTTDNGTRVASFSGVRRDGGSGTTTSGTRYAASGTQEGFGKVSKPDAGATGSGPTVFRGSQAGGTTFSSTTKTSGKAGSNGPVVYRGSGGTSTPTFTSTARTSGGKTSGSGPIVYRGSGRQSTQFAGATTRSSGGKAFSGGTAVYRGPGNPSTFTSVGRPSAKGGISGGQVYSQPARGFGGVSRGSFSGSRPTSSGFGSTTIRSSGGTGRSGASVRSSGGMGGSVRPSGGGMIGGGARISGFGGVRRQ